MVQAPTGSIENIDEGIEPLCQREKEDTTANAGCQASEGEGANQAGCFSSSELKDEMPELEDPIHKIIREGKIPIGERKTLEADVEDQPYSPMSEHRSMMPGRLIRIVESLYHRISCLRKLVCSR